MINQDKSADKKSGGTVVSVHRGLNSFEMAQDGIRSVTTSSYCRYL